MKLTPLQRMIGGATSLVAQRPAARHAKCDADGDYGDDGGLLYLGNWHDSIPRQLLEDPVLEPVDKIVWAIIRTYAEPGSPVAFPRYEEIARKANVAARATIARAIAILRMTRWLSVAQRVRDDQGRFRGVVYALHDEPITLADAIQLDPEYMTFLSDMTRHKHARVQLLAATQIEVLEHELANGHDVMGQTLLECRYSNCVHRARQAKKVQVRMASLTTQNAAAFHRDEHEHGVTHHPVKNLNSVERDSEHRVQNLNPVKTQVKNLNSVENAEKKIFELGDRSSSKYINIKNTTTTTTDYGNSARATPVDPAPLAKNFADDDRDERIFPAELGDNVRMLLAMQLKTLPANAHQTLLDELAGVLDAKRRHGDPIQNPVGYFQGMCRKFRAGEFHPAYADAVQQARQPTATPPSTSPTPESPDVLFREIRLHNAHANRMISQLERDLRAAERLEQHDRCEALRSQLAYWQGQIKPVV